MSGHQRLRRTDAELKAIVAGEIPLTITRESAMALVEEVLEARARGVTGTVDVASHMKEGEPVSYAGGFMVMGSGLTVVSWCPDEEAKAPPEQVHMIHDLGSGMSGKKSVVRLKSGVGVDSLIQALYDHRRHVWPGYKGLRVKGRV